MAEQVWMVRAGRNAIFLPDFIESKMVAIGWQRIGDLANVHGRAAISQLVALAYPEDTMTQRIVSAGQLYRFRDELIQGKQVITYDQNSRRYHLGVITGDYLYRPQWNEHCRHTRGVQWKRIINRDELSPATKNSLGGIATIFCISPEASVEILGQKTAKPIDDEPTPVASASDAEATQEIRKDTEQRALEFLQDRLSQLDWQEMQDMVAGLLRAMGYKTKVSPPGADRGRDILASPDGFGFQSPRILVEVKHRAGAMGAPAIRSFAGGLRPQDNGLYVSTGGFTREARYEAERSNHPITLMDSDDLGSAIIEHYDRMDLETRTLLPMKKIYWPV